MDLQTGPALGAVDPDKDFYLEAAATDISFSEVLLQETNSHL